LEGQVRCLLVHPLDPEYVCVKLVLMLQYMMRNLSLSVKHNDPSTICRPTLNHRQLPAFNRKAQGHTHRRSGKTPAPLLSSLVRKLCMHAWEYAAEMGVWAGCACAHLQTRAPQTSGWPHTTAQHAQENQHALIPHTSKN